jgi:hypothetical protein
MCGGAGFRETSFQGSLPPTPQNSYGAKWGPDQPKIHCVQKGLAQDNEILNAGLGGSQDEWQIMQDQQTGFLPGQD